MKNKLLITFCLLAVVFSGFSQTQNLQKVHITYSDGTVKDKYFNQDIANYQKIYVFNAVNSPAEELLPEDLQFIKDEAGNELIKTHRVGLKNYFMKLLVNGEASLYYFQDDNTNQQFVSETPEFGIRELVQTSIEKKIDQKTYNAVTRQYLGTLQLLFNKCPNPGLEKTRYSVKDLSDAFIAYNNCRSNLTYTSPLLKKRPEYRWGFLAGMNINTVDTYFTQLVENFDPVIGLQAGMEFTYIPTIVSSRFNTTLGIFYSEKGGSAKSLRRNFEILEVYYKTLDLNFGVRYNILPIHSKVNPYVGLNLNKGLILNNLNKDIVKVKENGEREAYYENDVLEPSKRFNLGLTYEIGVNFLLNQKSGLTAKGLYYSSNERSGYFKVEGIIVQAGYFLRL